MLLGFGDSGHHPWYSQMECEALTGILSAHHSERRDMGPLLAGILGGGGVRWNDGGEASFSLKSEGGIHGEGEGVPHTYQIKGKPTAHHGRFS